MMHRLGQYPELDPVLDGQFAESRGGGGVQDGHPDEIAVVLLQVTQHSIRVGP